MGRRTAAEARRPPENGAGSGSSTEEDRRMISKRTDIAAKDGNLLPIGITLENQKKEKPSHAPLPTR
jgi:hypothetical protein